MGVTERRAREKEELRSKIMEAATALLVEEGFQNVSMRRIAERIEYSPSTIYLYFKDKAALVTSICLDTFTQLIDSLDQIGSSTLPPVAKMRKCLRAYIDFGLAHPNHYFITFCIPDWQWRDLSGDCEKEIQHMGDQAFQRLRDGVSGGMAAGVFRKDDVETVSQSVWMMIHGVTSLLITMGQHYPWVDREILIDTTIDRIVRSLGV